MSEKRKNGAPPRFQWWLLVVGFGLGVVLTLAVNMRNQPKYVSVGETVPNAELWLTATQIIREATAAAEGLVLPGAAQPTDDPALDSFMGTATTMVAQATQTAQARP